MASVGSQPRQSGGSYGFDRVPRTSIPRSSFDLTETVKTGFDAGLLIPLYHREILPGDTFNVSMDGFARLATPVFPIMDNLYFETFGFFVPNRLLWDNWQRFMGEQISPGASTDFTVPVCSDFTAVRHDMADYFGLPVGVTLSGINALPFRAYSLVFNEWFRDQNLVQNAFISTNDGPDDYSLYQLKRRGKRHDYFTSSLPWPQKGEAVSIPLGTRADVTFDGVDGDPVNIRRVGGGAAYRRLTTEVIPPAINENVVVDSIGDGFGSALYADLSTATAATINSLRQAFQVQKLLERDARGGTRYIEILKSHFDVSSPDARLQRPEYLGGGRSYVNISPIAQTTSTDATSPQGNLAAIGTSVVNNHGFTKSFVEHGQLIVLGCVRADLTYQQGVERKWSRQTRYDYFWPALQHIGEQAVLNKEIYYSDIDGLNDEVWGYQERYAEYRYGRSKITGALRSGGTQNLDRWHLAEDFGGTRPTLNEAFMEENPPVARVLALPDEPDLIFDGRINVRAARPLPVYGVPGLIDHF